MSYGEITSGLGRPIARSGPSADARDADSGCSWYDNSGGLSLIDVILLDLYMTRVQGLDIMEAAIEANNDSDTRS